MSIFCDNCKHFKGDGEKCVDDITVGFSGIPLKECDSYEPMSKFKYNIGDILKHKDVDVVKYEVVEVGSDYVIVNPKISKADFKKLDRQVDNAMDKITELINEQELPLPPAFYVDYELTYFNYFYIHKDDLDNYEKVKTMVKIEELKEGDLLVYKGEYDEWYDKYIFYEVQSINKDETSEKYILTKVIIDDEAWAELKDQLDKAMSNLHDSFPSCANIRYNLIKEDTQLIYEYELEDYKKVTSND